MTSRGRVLVTNRIENSGGGEKSEEIAKKGKDSPMVYGEANKQKEKDYGECRK